MTDFFSEACWLNSHPPGCARRGLEEGRLAFAQKAGKESDWQGGALKASRLRKAWQPSMPVASQEAPGRRMAGRVRRESVAKSPTFTSTNNSPQD